jgi:5-oxoprolinase (ATP-hydrolysing) subunit A
MKLLLNCDLGENDEISESGSDFNLLPFIDMANIACGGHAGSEAVVRAMIVACDKQGVRIGAHPSYPDRVQFGRVSRATDVGLLRGWLSEQLGLFSRVARECGVSVHHVKPHGALYHDASVSDKIARIVVESSFQILGNVVVVAPPDSALESVAVEQGLDVMAEAFADRRYTASLALQPRTTPGSVLSPGEAEIQVRQMLNHGTTPTTDGPRPIRFQTLCIHSDSPNALDMLKTIRFLLH